MVSVTLSSRERGKSTPRAHPCRRRPIDERGISQVTQNHGLVGNAKHDHASQIQEVANGEQHSLLYDQVEIVHKQTAEEECAQILRIKPTAMCNRDVCVIE